MTTKRKRPRGGGTPRPAAPRQQAKERAGGPSEPSRAAPELPDAVLQPRDRGPVRAYVRDVVDSRRHLVGLFIPAFGGVLITTLGPASDLQRTIQLISLVLLAVAVAEAVRLGVSVTRMARAEFPHEEISGPATGWYAFMRAHRMRSMRLPPPRTAPGRAGPDRRG